MRSRSALMVLALSLAFAQESGWAQEPQEESEELEAINRTVMDLQERFAAERASTSEALRRILRRKVVVPLPGEQPERVESVREAWAAVVPPVATARIALVTEARIGPGQGAGISWKRSSGVTMSINDPDVAFGDEIRWETKDDFSAGLNIGAHCLSQNIESEQSLEFSSGNAWLGVSRSGETYGVNVGSGLALEATSMLRFKIGLEESLSLTWAEESVRGFAHALALTGRTAWASGSRAARAVMASLRESRECIYCSALGAIPCPRCNDERTITCPDCSGEGWETCSRCEGGGQLSCSPTESCGSCRGGGRNSCGACGGCGTVTSYEEYTEWRNVLLPGGFDSSGNPIYRNEYQPFTHTRSIQVTCSSCGGSGDGGQCGTCNGSGQVTCSTCGGAGTVACSSCGGSGRVACGRCDGEKVITCPLCDGAPLLCPLCEGLRRLEPTGGRR